MVSPVAPAPSTGDRETKQFEQARPVVRGGGGANRRGRRGPSIEELPRNEAKPAEPAKRPSPADDAPLIEVYEDVVPVAGPAAPAPLTGPAALGPAPLPVSALPTSAPVAPGLMPSTSTPSTVVSPGQPPAPAATAETPENPPAESEETKRLLDDLDAGFESIVRPSAPPGPIGGPGSSSDEAQPGQVSQDEKAARHEADMAEVRKLFAGIAVSYARPLRDFMIEVAWGEPTKEWLDVALPATYALRRAAGAVELPAVDAALEGYLTALELALGESTIHREVREMLNAAYAKLIDALPQVFALEGEIGRREPIIVRSLLLQVPGVRHVAIEKLYRAGINALDVFYAARPRELADATGIDEPVTAAICERFQRYRREAAELSPGSDRAKERADLAALVDALAAQHEAYERASKAWSARAAADKAKARKEREETVLRINLLLAHLGEVDLQRTLAKVPFQQKIRELRRYLDEAKQKATRV
jgi:hypothetical protein